MLQFVNHASFIIRWNGVALCTDPWFSGRAFDDSWALLIPTPQVLKNPPRIKYLWISHAHPDHFSTETLSHIEPKPPITVLTVRTKSKTIQKGCRTLGFGAVVELDQDAFILGSDFSILARSFSGGDSWAYFKVGSLGILNTNDCVIRSSRDLALISRHIGQVDVLLTKFSYSSWAGNPEDVSFRQSIAERRLSELCMQVNWFRPRWTIPIGNHFFFCHPENAYLNDLLVTPGVVFQRLTEQGLTTPIVLFPGDLFEPNSHHDSHAAIGKYNEAYLGIRNFQAPNVSRENVVSEDELELAWANWSKNRAHHSNRAESCTIHVTDLEMMYRVSPQGFMKLNAGLAADVAMASSSLLSCLKHRFGADDVRIGGRLRGTEDGVRQFLSLFRNQVDILT